VHGRGRKPYFLWKLLNTGETPVIQKIMHLLFPLFNKMPAASITETAALQILSSFCCGLEDLNNNLSEI
jgi:hypothetical protein